MLLIHNLRFTFILGVIAAARPCFRTLRPRHAIGERMAENTTSSDGQTWRKLSSAELKKVLENHQRFLAKIPGGRRADLSFHDLTGIDLSGRDLSEADLSGARLKQARLAGTKLTRATLFCADLRMANLERADLTGADMRGACLRGAELSDAVLSNVDLRQASMARYSDSGGPQLMEFEEVPSQLTAIVAHRVDLAHARIANAYLLQADFTDANLSFVDMTGADLRNAVLVGASFEGAQLRNADLSGAALTGADLSEASIQGAKFENADLRGTVLNIDDLDCDEIKSALLPEMTRPTEIDLAMTLAAHNVWLESDGHFVTTVFDMLGRVR